MNILHFLAPVLFLWLPLGHAAAQTLVVNSADDTDDGACDALHCSLREAIRAANQNPGPDTVTFAVTGGPAFITILPASPLPALTDAGTVIDAVSQVGGNALAAVTIDGANAGAGATGFEINAPNCTIMGFGIRRFVNGIRVSGSNARIGPLNLIGNNSGAGILLAPGANNAIIRWNHIGAEEGGVVAIPNGHGIRVDGPVSNLVIGGVVAGQYNLIAGNTGEGIWVQDATNLSIQSNLVGFSIFAPGMTLSNGGNGILVENSTNVRIDNGNNPNTPNYIAGNGENGIRLVNCSNFIIEGNVVYGNEQHGIELLMLPGIAPADGVIAGNRIAPVGAGSGNAGFGIWVTNAYNLLIGSPGQGNHIAGNGQGGIQLSNSLDVIIEANNIGINAAGGLVQGNAGPGVLVNAFSEGILIGGQNVIAHNAGPGVQIAGESLSCTITQNSIFCNAGGGIQVAAGANDDIAPPREICAGPTEVSGMAGPFDIVELFRHSHSSCDAPPCQGRVYIASTLAEFDGRWSIPGAFNPGDTLTATATNLLGSTSEFSHCVPVTELPLAVASNSGPVCAGQEVELIGEVQPPAVDAVFEWAGPANFSSHQADTSGVFPAGIYTLAVSRGFCRSAPDTTVVAILPEASALVQTTLCHRASITVNGTVYDASNPSGIETLDSAAANGCDSIVSIDLRFFPPAESRMETTLCAGQSLSVNGTIYNEANPSGFEILAGAGANGCDSIVEVNLAFHPPAASRIEQGICPDEFVAVNGQVYDRSRLSGTETIAGGSANGCDSVVTVNLSLLPVPEFTMEQTICPGASLVINRTVYDETRLNGTEILAGAAANGCDSIVQVHLTVNDLLAGLGRDTILRITRGQTAEIGPGLSFTPDRITWTPATGLSCSDCPNPVAAPASNAVYTALVEHQGCTATLVVRITVIERLPVYAPTAFSPNDDGINDRFTLYADAQEVPRIALLRVFDRWGGLVFEGKEIPPGETGSGWDGKAHGRDCPMGTYIYMAEVQTASGDTAVLKGEVNLLR